MFKIGNVEIDNQLVIAPLAGISNPAFRSIAYDFNAGLVYTEMVSDKALMYNNAKTFEMTVTYENEHPLAMQLFGNEIESMVKGAIYLDTKTDCDIIDINMGCPVTKVVKQGSGSALMKNVDQTVAMVEAVVKAVKKPVTVKMRTGFTKTSKNAVELAKKLEAVGVSAITVHGRTKSELYAGQANWDDIKAVKEAVKIPVIGNGDVKSLADFIEKLAYSKCDAIMIGRGIVGNPFLIKEIVAYLNNEEYQEPTFKDRIDMCLVHASRLCELKGENVAMKQMRSLASWYIGGMPYSSRIKNETSQLKTLAQLKELYYNYLNELKDLADKDQLPRFNKDKLATI